jgi:hypothetical protein
MPAKLEIHGMRFLKRRREEKLYKQWAKHNGLPVEAIPQKEVAGDRRTTGEERDRTYQYREKLLAIVKKLLRV